jgi:mono/diheme cytochrome c family protein/uncharacterized membrane protein
VNKTIVCVIVVAAAAVPCRASPPQARDDLAPSVRAIFKEKCAACHGPELAKPKGRFGYILDLKRLAANPELVVSGKPDESALWQIIRRDEMPPSKPLPADEKDAVRAWIVSGAPPVADEVVRTSSVRELGVDTRRLLDAVGRFHLALLHFPIAFLIAAAVIDLRSATKTGTGPSPALRFCVLAGAVTAVLAATLGWAYAAAGHGTGTPATLAWHRWLGTGVAAWSVGAALVVERAARRGKHSSAAQLLVLLGAFLVGATAYFGGALVHGEIWSDW